MHSLPIRALLPSRTVKALRHTAPFRCTACASNPDTPKKRRRKNRSEPDSEFSDLDFAVVESASTPEEQMEQEKPPLSWQAIASKVSALDTKLRQIYATKKYWQKRLDLAADGRLSQSDSASVPPQKWFEDRVDVKAIEEMLEEEYAYVNHDYGNQVDYSTGDQDGGGETFFIFDSAAEKESDAFLKSELMDDFLNVQTFDHTQDDRSPPPFSPAEAYFFDRMDLFTHALRVQPLPKPAPPANKPPFDGKLDSPHGKHCPYDSEMDFFADAVEYEDPFICFRGRELFRSYMQSIANHGARMVINDIYQARLRSQPEIRTIATGWLLFLKDESSDSNPDQEYSMGVTETSAAFIQGRTDYSLHKSGKIISVKSVWNHKLSSSSPRHHLDDFALARQVLASIWAKGVD